MKQQKRQGAVIINPDGSMTPHVTKNERTFTLAEAQNIVGGYIETVNLQGEKRNFIMIVNEEGKNMGLPVNVNATIIAKTYMAICPGDYIVGNAILCPAEMLP